MTMNENIAVNAPTPLCRSSILRQQMVSVITPIYGEEDNLEPLFCSTSTGASRAQ